MDNNRRKPNSEENKRAFSLLYSRSVEVMLGVLMGEPAVKSSALALFSSQNPSQRKTIENYIKQNKHMVLASLSPADRISYLKMYGALFTQNEQKEYPIINIIRQNFGYQEIMEELFLHPIPQSFRGAVMDTFFAHCFRDDEAFLKKVFSSCKMEKAEQITVPDIETEINVINERSAVPEIRTAGRYNIDVCGAVIFSVLDKNYDPKLRQVMISGAPQAMGLRRYEEIDYGVVEKIIRDYSEGMGLEAGTYGVKDFTQAIKTGRELIARMEKNMVFYPFAESKKQCIFTKGDKDRQKTKNDYFDLYVKNGIFLSSTSINNAMMMVEETLPSDSLRMAVENEVISKKDRMKALQTAYTNYVQERDKAVQPVQFCMDGDGWWKDTNSASKFFSVYLLSLYQIVVTRKYYREITATAFDAIYNSGGEKCAIMDEERRKEVERLYHDRDEQKERAEKAEKTVSELQIALSNAQQVIRKDKTQKVTIAGQKETIAKLEEEVQRLQQALEERDAETMPGEDEETEPAMPSGPTYEAIHQYLLDACSRMSIVVIDGHDGFQSKLRESLPDIKLVGHGRLSKIEEIISSASIVLCKSRAYGSHTMSEKAGSLARVAKVPFVILSRSTNIEITEREIHNSIMSNIPCEQTYFGEHYNNQ